MKENEFIVGKWYKGIQQFLPEGHPDLLVKIPEKWYIRTNADTEPIVTKYIEKKFRHTYHADYMFGKGWGFVNTQVDLVHPNNSCPDGYTEITFEFFEKHILNTKEMKKIIGYKCPTDLFNRGVKIGTIYYKTFGNCYSIQSNDSKWNSDPFLLPKEIVETWEAIYKEDSKTLTLGDKDVKVTISKGKIEAEGGNIPIKYLTNLYERMNNTVQDKFEWGCTHTGITNNIQFPNVKLGCTTFTKEEVKLVIDTYNELNS
jgi:hypothetical protein